MAKKKYTGTVTLRTARPRSRRLRELGIGGAVTISTTAGGSSSEGSDTSAYASEAGHAAEADRATSADTAQNLAQDSTDWQFIDQKDAETLESAKQYADGNFLSKKADDTAEGFLTLLKGAEFGPDGAWGWVRKTGDVVKSWFKNLWTDILTVTNYLTGEGGLLTLKGNVSIAKDTPNGRNGNLSVAGDISGQNATMAGTLGAKNVNVSDTITTKNLRVEGSAYFWELVTDVIRAAGGAWLITPADGFTVEKVVAISGGYRLLWKASDGKKATRSQWVKGMQAICRTMNAAEGTNYNLSNKYYWALVTNAGTGTSVGTIDGETYHWIELSSSTKDPSCTLNPEEGDEIAQLGYRRQSASEDNKEVLARQSAIYIAAYQSIDSGAAAPVVSIYEGIKDFELSKYRVSTMSPQLVEFLADRLRIVTGTGSSTTITGYINDLFDELDIPEGIDGVSVGIDPPEYIVTETYNAAYDTMDYDLSDGAELATVWARQGAENCPVQIMELTYDQTATTLSIGYNNRILFYGRDKMAAGNFKKLAVSVKARVTYTVKAATATTPAETATKDISLKFMLYVNRGGTTTMYTYNDLTRIIRERTAFAYDEQGIVREFAYKSDVTDAADRFSRQMSALPLARNLLLNTEFLDAADGLPLVWDEWNNSGTAYTRTVTAASGVKWQRLYIRPTAQFQGIIQTSADVNAATTGDWKYRKDLKHGGYYALSFYAYRAGSASSRADCIVHFRKVNADGTYSGINSAQASREFMLTTAWKRYWFAFQVLPTSNIDTAGYGFAVMLGCSHDSVPTNEQLIFSRPQLEEITQEQYEAWAADNSKEVVSEWRRGEERAEVMSSQIEQTAEQISMSVRKGEKVGGIKITETGTTLYGEQTVVEGDLDLQGLTTENVKIVGRNPFIPTVVNMGIGAANANEVNKSVQVKIGEYDSQSYYQDTHHMVVLPFYDSAFRNWASGNLPTGNFKTDVPETDPLFGSFNILPQSINTGYSTVQLADWERRIVQWRKNGTRLTIANEHDPKRANWKDIERWTSWGNDNYGNTNRQHVGELLKHAVVVCSDARLLAHWNIAQANPYSAGYAEGDTQTTGDGGMMSCNGHKARFILLLPGQTLQLRSQILNLGTERKVLAWLVENPSEFVPMTFGINVWRVSGGYEQDIASALRSRSSACYVPIGGTNAVTEVMLGPELVNLTVSQASSGTSQADSWTQQIGVDICVD